MYALLKKEISSFLNSLIGYITIIVFLLVNGMFLFIFPTDFNIMDYGFAGLDGMFAIAPYVFLFLIPAITMRFFADEKKSGTIELLVTRPLSDLQIILGKFLAGIILVFFSILPTLIYMFTVYQLGMPKGNLDFGAAWGSYLGLLLLGSSFVSIGVFSSSITDSQIVSFLVSVVLAAFLYIGFDIIHSLALFGQAGLFIRSLGIGDHYASISRGVVDTRDVIYFISLMTFFILLTKISLESRKW